MSREPAAGLAHELARMAEELAGRLSTRQAGDGTGVPVVGTDVQEVAPVARAVREQGRRYLDRVYTPHEVETAGLGVAAEEVAAASLAARFAVKESVLKVLGSPGGVPLTDVEVRRRADGGCDVVLTGVAEEHAVGIGLHAWDVSISHDGGVAVAIVMALRRTPGHA